MSTQYEDLKLEKQLCFPLYAAAREVVKQYHPHLAALDLTYTQYIALMVLWEEKQMSVKKMGEKLHLDSGTLTPVLKSIEKKGYITRNRSTQDERVLLATVTEEGMKLRDRIAGIPELVTCNVALTAAESAELYRLLYKLLDGVAKG